MKDKEKNMLGLLKVCANATRKLVTGKRKHLALHPRAFTVREFLVSKESEDLVVTKDWKGSFERMKKT